MLVKHQILNCCVINRFKQDRNLDWFPRLRAMSLLMAAQVEGESDQVELRGLQTQLETTQTLVALLSQQLSELKEQVRYYNNCNNNDNYCHSQTNFI